MRRLARDLLATRRRVGLVVLAVAAFAAIVVGVTHNTLAQSGQRRATAGVTASATAPAKPAPTPTATVDPWTVSGLSVSGLQIVDQRGEPVTLLGASRFSLEYSCHGDGHFQLADFQAMRAWGMNTVRIPLSSAYWRNLGQQCPDYRATVASAVTTAEAAGLHVILDLQRNAPLSLPQDGATGGAQCPLPDTRYDVSFWQDLAALYRNDPHVLFDLFGEPYYVGWSQWFNGGAVTSDCYAYGRPYTYTAIGMPALAAAVRASAPRTILILSGTGWGYDLSAITPTTAPQLTNVLYGTHPWNHRSIQQPFDWQRAFGETAQRLPVIATEFGAYDCGTGYIASEIAYFQRLHISYLAWAWSTGGCATPGLLSGWSGEPTTPYGQYILQQMRQADTANPAPFQ